MRTTLLAAVVALTTPIAAQAAVIDFDDLDSSPAQSLLTSFSEDGFSFDVSFVSDGNAEGVAVFDTTCVGNACNGDTDLVPAVQGENGIEGNVLILQEPNVARPDDDLDGGLFVLTLTSGSAFRFTGASAIDDTDFEFGTRVNGTDTFFGAISLSSNSETGSTTFNSNVVQVGDSILVRTFGSGGFDSLVLTAVPVPAALPLMLGGLAGLGALSRRRKAKG